MQENEQPKRRWHDDRGHLSEAIDILEHIPEAVIPLIAEGLTMRADKEFQAGEILKSLRSLGTNKILALHKSQQKKRSYDQNPNLHRIVSYFYILPEQNQDQLATQFLDFTGLVVDYLANCDSFGIASQEAELLELRNRFVNHGTSAARKYLMEVHAECFELARKELDADNASPSTDDDLTASAEKTQTIISSQHGLRIREL